MADTYDLILEWPHTDAHTVIATGTFDSWSSSVHLKRTESGFTGKVAVPWDSKILYKFIVDDNWVTHGDQPTEYDGAGNVNNVVHSPAKPVAPQPIEPAGKESASKDVPHVHISEPEVAASSTLEDTKEKVAIDNQAKEKTEAPVEVAPIVPLEIQPVLDGSTNTSPESKTVFSDVEASTHKPAPASEVAADASPAPASESASAPTPAAASEPAPASTLAPASESAPEAPAPAPIPIPAPSTPPRTKSKLSPSVPVTPIKTNGTGLAHAHARSSTGTSTPPSSSAPSTPKTQSTFPVEEASPGRLSLGRKKKHSFFGKIKAALSPDKEKKKRLGSMSPRSASPTPRKSDK